MPACLLIAILSLCAALLLTGVCCLTNRRWRALAVCLAASLILVSTGTAGVIELARDGVHAVWNKTVGKRQQERDRKNADDAKRRAEKIATRKALTDPAVLQKAPEDFFTYNGFRDWWRLPLVFPYELEWIDTFESANLQRHRGGDVRDPNKSSENVQDIGKITHCSFDRRFLIGRQGPTSFDKDRPESWFIFEFAPATFKEFGSESKMLEAAKSRGYTGGLSLKSIEQNYNDYFR